MRGLICFLVLIINLPVTSQKLEWSNEQRFKGRSNRSTVIGRTESSIYLLKKKTGLFNSSTTIEKYKANMSLEWAKELETNDEFIKIALLNKQLTVFTSRPNRDKGTIILYAQHYDENLNKSGKELKLDEALSRTYYDNGDFDIDISADRSKVFCFHSEKSSDKKFIARILILDSSLSKFAEKRVELPLKYDDFKVLSFSVNNAGDAAFNAVVYDDEKRRNDPMYAQHMLFVFNAGTETLNDFAVNDDEHFIYDISLLNDELNRRFTVAGFYSETDVASFEGVFQLSIDIETQKEAIAYYSAFSTDFLTRLIGERAASRKNPSLNDFEIRKIIQRSDGGIQVVAEKFYITTQTQTYYFQGIPQTTSRSFFNYDDIIVLSLSPAGEYSWSNVINKSQSSVNDAGYYSSFILLVEKEGIRIIFNDRLRNNGDVIQYFVSNSGKQNFSILLKSQNYYVAVIPSESRQIDNRTIIIPTNKDRRFALLKLSY